MSQGQQATVTNHKVSESRPKPKGQELESLQLGPLTQKVQALLNKLNLAYRHAVYRRFHSRHSTGMLHLNVKELMAKLSNSPMEHG